MEREGKREQNKNKSTNKEKDGQRFAGSYAGSPAASVHEAGRCDEKPRHERYTQSEAKHPTAAATATAHAQVYGYVIA